MGASLAMVKKGSNKPQNRVQSEKPEHPEQKQIHEFGCKVQRRKRFPLARVGVRLVSHKASCHIQMALAASPYQICRRYGRIRIIGRKNVVLAVTIPAMSRCRVAQRGDLRMECVEVACKMRLMTVSACGRGLILEGCRAHGRNLMGGVAIAANRRVEITGLE